MWDLNWGTICTLVADLQVLAIVQLHPRLHTRIVIVFVIVIVTSETCFLLCTIGRCFIITHYPKDPRRL